MVVLSDMDKTTVISGFVAGLTLGHSLTVCSKNVPNYKQSRGGNSFGFNTPAFFIKRSVNKFL